MAGKQGTGGESSKDGQELGRIQAQVFFHPSSAGTALQGIQQVCSEASNIFR